MLFPIIIYYLIAIYMSRKIYPNYSEMYIKPYNGLRFFNFSQVNVRSGHPLGFVCFMRK